MCRFFLALVFIVCSAASGDARTIWTADTSIYVSLAGSDATGDGTIAAPFRSVQKAVMYFCNNIDTAGFQAKIKLTGWVSGGEHVFNEGGGVLLGQYLGGSGGAGQNRFPIIEGDPNHPERYRIIGSQRAILGVSTWQSWLIDGVTLNSPEIALQADGPIAFYIRNVRFTYSKVFLQGNLFGTIIIAGPLYFSDRAYQFAMQAVDGGQVVSQPGRSITLETGFDLYDGTNPGVLMLSTFGGKITLPSDFVWNGITLPNRAAYHATHRGVIFKQNGPNFPANMATTGSNPSIASVDGAFYP